MTVHLSGSGMHLLGEDATARCGAKVPAADVARAGPLVDQVDQATCRTCLEVVEITAAHSAQIPGAADWQAAEQGAVANAAARRLAELDAG